MVGKHASLVLIIVLTTLSKKQTASGGILESLPNLSDEILDPKFQIAVHRSPIGDGYDVRYKDLMQIPMRDAQGTDHVCFLPSKGSLPEEQEQAVIDLEAVVPPSTLLKSLAERCVVKTLDWWTYEVCHQSQIRQFHIQGDQVDQEYVLGLYSTNKSDVDAIQRETGPTGVSKPYVHEVFEGGSTCEVHNVQRSAEVRYACSAGSDKTDILSVRELHSCKYQVVVTTPLLCQHPAFKDVQVPVHDINCFPTGEVEGRGVSRSDVKEPWARGSAGAVAGGQNSKYEEVRYDLEGLSDEALNELVSNIILQTSHGDPDVDFLGLADEDYTGGDERDEGKASGTEAERRGHAEL